MKTLINTYKVNKAYISEIDYFLDRFDRRHPKLSESQEQEIEQYQQLFSKRDKKTALYSH